jgi:hypothetical protein
MNKQKYEEIKKDFVETHYELSKKNLIIKNKLHDFNWNNLTPNNIIFVIAMTSLVLFRFLIISVLFYGICILLIYALTLGNIDFPNIEKILPADSYLTWALMIYGGYYLPIYYKELTFKRKIRKIKNS